MEQVHAYQCRDAQANRSLGTMPKATDFPNAEIMVIGFLSLSMAAKPNHALFLASSLVQRNYYEKVTG